MTKKSTLSTATKTSKIVQFINKKSRLNRKEFLDWLDEDLNGKKKKEKLSILDRYERSLSAHLSIHIAKCGIGGECLKEVAYDKAFDIIQLQKREIIQDKTFWENIESNPVGIGIVLIGIGNIIIALVSLFK